MSERWYYVLSGQRQGPVEFSAIESLVAAGQITPESLMWKPYMPEWTPAIETDLQHLFVGNPEPPPITGQHSRSAETGKVTVENWKGEKRVVDDQSLPPLTVIPGHETHGITSIPWRYVEACTDLVVRKPLVLAWKTFKLAKKAISGNQATTPPVLPPPIRASLRAEVPAAIRKLPPQPKVVAEFSQLDSGMPPPTPPPEMGRTGLFIQPPVDQENPSQ